MCQQACHSSRGCSKCSHPSARPSCARAWSCAGYIHYRPQITASIVLTPLYIVRMMKVDYFGNPCRKQHSSQHLCCFLGVQARTSRRTAVLQLASLRSGWQRRMYEGVSGKRDSQAGSRTSGRQSPRIGECVRNRRGRTRAHQKPWSPAPVPCATLQARPQALSPFPNRVRRSIPTWHIPGTESRRRPRVGESLRFLGRPGAGSSDR
jgi:hypothetical protein